MVEYQAVEESKEIKNKHFETKHTHTHLLTQLEQCASSSNHNALLNCCLGGVQSILHTQLLLFELSLCLGTDLCTIAEANDACDIKS